MPGTLSDTLPGALGARAEAPGWERVHKIKKQNPYRSIVSSVMLKILLPAAWSAPSATTKGDRQRNRWDPFGRHQPLCVPPPRHVRHQVLQGASHNSLRDTQKRLGSDLSSRRIIRRRARECCSTTTSWLTPRPPPDPHPALLLDSTSKLIFCSKVNFPINLMGGIYGHGGPGTRIRVFRGTDSTFISPFIKGRRGSTFEGSIKSYRKAKIPNSGKSRLKSQLLRLT